MMSLSATSLVMRADNVPSRHGSEIFSAGTPAENVIEDFYSSRQMRCRVRWVRSVPSPSYSENAITAESGESS